MFSFNFCESEPFLCNECLYDVLNAHIYLKNNWTILKVNKNFFF